MTNSPDALATALEALDAKATPGPWHHTTAMDAVVHRPDGSYFTVGDAVYHPRMVADAELICELRNALPELLAALRASRGPQVTTTPRCNCGGPCDCEPDDAAPARIDDDPLYLEGYAAAMREVGNHRDELAKLASMSQVARELLALIDAVRRKR